MIILENKGNNCIANHSIEYHYRERIQQDFNAYSIECNVILLENKGINDIANHLMEFDFTRKQGSCWATNGISSGGKESVGIQCISN